MLEQIAQVIREDPSVTVKDIARKLGYSEEKSVYYWLEKGQFKGLRDFRHAVLTGRFPRGSYIVGAGDPAKDPGATYPLHEVPLITSFSPEGRPIPSSQNVSSMVPASRDTFGFILGTDEYSPFLVRGDVLLVDPPASVGQGDLVLVNSEGNPRIVRFYSAGGNQVLVHPAHPAEAAVQSAQAVRVIGKVTGVVRRFNLTC
ncbi:MAG: hypothetical protein HPY55_11265 [Firmicutes bacterium]|nr:hypothetical protein [Bacillota bacterium]